MTDIDCTPYRVWIGPGNNVGERSEQFIHALNTPGEGALKWPVSNEDQWPVVFGEDIDGNRTYSGVYNVFEHGIFRPHAEDHFPYGHRWDLELFSRFAASRPSLHYRHDDGSISPTLAALSSLLRADILVDEDQGSFHRVRFIAPDGSITVARHDGQDATMELIRNTFFEDGIKPATELICLTIETIGGDEPEPLESQAFNRMGQFRDWTRQHRLGYWSVPEGSRLAPSDFQVAYSDDIDPDRPVMAAAATPEHRYEIIFPDPDSGDYYVDPMEVLCAVDGELQEYADPLTGEEGSYGATMDQWCYWILCHTVPGGLKASGSHPWEGEGADAALYRVEHNIVSYRNFETSTSQFRTGQDLEFWLRHALRGHNAPLEVHVLDDVALMLDRVPLPTHQQHTYASTDEGYIGLKKSSRVLDLWDGAAAWQEDGADAWHPVMQTRMDGAAIQSYMATHCIDLDDYQDYLRGPWNKGQWYVISLEGTRTGILIPAFGAVLIAEVDDDGAAATITARDEKQRLADRDAEEKFHSRWASWLDESHTLTRDEIRDGLAAVGRLVAANGGTWS